jgi:hypothetical protein
MIAIALVVVAVTGTTFVLLPALGCVAMMAMMMWMMGSTMGGRTHDSSSNAPREEK